MIGGGWGVGGVIDFLFNIYQSSIYFLSPILSDLPSIDDHCFVLMSDEDGIKNNIDENCVKFVQSSK